VDAAARILDPVLSAVNIDYQTQHGASEGGGERHDIGGKQNHTKAFGKFFKDYHETEW
jgi:hypothetical protein